MSGPTLDTTTVSNGAHAHQLLEKHGQRLLALHDPVLANQDPEPLHQMRVAMRRLRSCLSQFGPALELPAAIGERRLSQSVKRLGMARDLDVLRDRLEGELLPQLPQAEIRLLKPTLKQLRRQRREAQRELETVLSSGRHRKLIAALQSWLHRPRYSELGEEPLAQWLLEWQWPDLGTLLLHPAWRLAQPRTAGEIAQVHNLRKGIKNVRYRLENLQPMAGPTARRWISQLKQAQELLGELNDLAVLRETIEAGLSGGLAEELPRLHGLLDLQHTGSWSRWRQLAQGLVAWPERRGLVQGLLTDPIQEPAG